MKKLLLITIFCGLPFMGFAGLDKESKTLHFGDLDIPNQFITSSKTSVFEWGCPVSEVVKGATSSAEAIRRIGEECLQEARRAASSKPDVTEVINADIIWPDILVTEEGGNFKLQGTIFMETQVLHTGSKE